MITAEKTTNLTYVKSTRETSSTGRMRKLSNYYEGEKGPYYGSKASVESFNIIFASYFEPFSSTEILHELIPARETSQKEKTYLKRLEASRRIDERRNKLRPIDITAGELVQEGRRLRQEELFGKDNDY